MLSFCLHRWELIPQMSDFSVTTSAYPTVFLEYPWLLLHFRSQQVDFWHLVTLCWRRQDTSRPQSFAPFWRWWCLVDVLLLAIGYQVPGTTLVSCVDASDEEAPKNEHDQHRDSDERRFHMISQFLCEDFVWYHPLHRSTNLTHHYFLPLLCSGSFYTRPSSGEDPKAPAISKKGELDSKNTWSGKTH